MAYVYRHIREDKNEPFYIGIGTDDSYYRANTKDGRSKFWRRIINKTPYFVEILVDDITLEQACLKEIEFVKLYGRKDLGTGTLCNLTDGGEGHLNTSPEVRKRLSESKKGEKNPNFGGKSMTEDTKLKISIANRGCKNAFYGKKYFNASKIVLNLENGIFYDSIKEASEVTNYQYKCFKAKLNGQSKNNTSFIIT